MGNCGAKTAVAKQQDMEDAFPSELTFRKKAELQDVLDADGIAREEGDPWLVVEAAWVQRWLAFVQGDDSVKKPGPIQNETLLVHDPASKAWVPKPLLRAARREHMGHYRRVNPHVWKKWAGTYRGSGPAIWVDKEPFEDTSNWQVDPAFDGVSKGRSGRGFGGSQGGEGWEKTGSAPGQPVVAHSLAIGDMEDEGVGEETTAQAAAFFDVTLDSPRVSASGGAAVSGGGGGGVIATSPAAALAGNGGAGGRPVRDPRSTSSGGGDGDKLERESTAAEMWMYGDDAATGSAQE
ncbi:expressed unknown protein [Ectocarpus siliculosus]|uniref:DUSP domain-containing protein n=1 Tax=Ectocarpus siliculosus TaxID=2880 RepID=D7FI23_ECTSI|nr:expressed unknown protein [Ectocarpus siliculosus]|eukprot:CBJ28649.1 expressed unknown protein [Ectocarpus siliculosus]